MSISLEDLAFAIYQEHKQRTGHDYAAPQECDRERCFGCMVCIYIGKVMHQAEEAHYAAQSPDSGRDAK